MKKLANILLGCIFISGALCTKEAVESYKNNTESPVITQTCHAKAEANGEKKPILSLGAKSAYLMGENGEVIFAERENERLPIASMCKIMTLLLTFEAIEDGRFGLEDEVAISERASSMGGSQVFLEANAKYPVKELIKSVVVCSANDSCVALAEKISGSEEAFTDRMNERAKELGATDTLYANCTGLPKEPQYSSAKDVALTLRALLSHPEYFEFGKIWMDKFQHPEGRYTEISNTNKLVRFYDGCDGGKTGFTNQAGFCLAATAKRDNMRVISVVIGEKTSQERFADVRKTFDYAFANYAQTLVLDASIPLEKQLSVSGGKEETLSVISSKNLYAFGKRGEKQNLKTLIHLSKDLKAPVKKGEKVGEIVLYKNNVEYDRADLLANETVLKASLVDRFQEVAKRWNAR